jgi:mandelamide amidase
MNDALAGSAVDQLARLRRRELSIAELVRSSLARIAAERALGAVIHTDESVVSARAEILEQGAVAGDAAPLLGLPIAVKDNIDTADFPTTAGTAVLRDHRPRRNAGAVQRLLDAGAVVVAKTNMDELAADVTCNNGVFGPGRNPYDPDLIPGGSSGGSAIAVSARMVAVALGTDTGGSARIPAALCGVCGFRPSTGRYPGEGVLRVSHTRDTVGLIARTVADLELIDWVLAQSPPAPPATPTQMRLGLPVSPFFEGLERATAAVIRDAIACLERAGVRTVEVDVTDVVQLNASISGPLVAHEFRRDVDAYLRGHGLDLGLREVAAGIGNPYLRRKVAALLEAADIGEAAYRRLIGETRPALQRAWEACFERFGIDALAYPTTPLTARPVGQDQRVDLDGISVPTFATYQRNCDPASVAGLPSLSLPAGLAASGLPVGLCLDGRRGGDARLLAIGGALARLLPPTLPPRLGKLQSE